MRVCGLRKKGKTESSVHGPSIRSLEIKPGLRYLGTKFSAEYLKERMNNTRKIVFVFSGHGTESKCMFLVN